MKQGNIHALTVNELEGMAPDFIVTSAAAGDMFTVKLFSLAVLLKVPNILCNSSHVSDLKVIIYTS